MVHRDTFFRNLRNIRKNDQIPLTTPGGICLYTASGTRAAEPENTNVLKPVGWPVLTLVTCCPFNCTGAVPKRLSCARWKSPLVLNPSPPIAKQGQGRKEQAARLIPARN